MRTAPCDGPGLATRGAWFGSRMPRLTVVRGGLSDRRAAVVVRADKALIVNTKGGGHAFIGINLARQLKAAGHEVILLNDGDKEKVSKKPPYNQYDKLSSEGIQVIWANPSDASSYPGDKIDVVYDNNAKDLETNKALIDHYKGKVSHFVFVGSAGAYKAPANEPLLVEGGPRKGGHHAVEEYLKEQDLPYTVFQPLYIYGPDTNKDCEQWFLERILRGRPVLLPAPGLQLTSLSHVDDVASMMATVPGNPTAVGQHYNVCSDRCISHEGIVKILAKAAGVEPKIVHFDPDAVKDFAGSKFFPFRTTHFFASAEKAKRELGWQPKHNFVDDAPALVEAFKQSGRLEKDVDISIDDQILKFVG